MRTDAGRELFTLSIEAALDSAGDEIEEGILRCDNPTCRRRYPILDGIPILVPDLSALLRGELDAVIERDLSPETAALLALAGPDEAPYAERLAHLSTYLDAHWGDRAEPPPDGPAHTPPFGMRELAARLAERAGVKVARAVELGASVGRGVAELARGAALTVGLDLHFGALRRARRLLSGAPLPYARRMTGRHYLPAVARAGELASRNVVWLCADALDSAACARALRLGGRAQPPRQRPRAARARLGARRADRARRRADRRLALLVLLAGGRRGAPVRRRSIPAVSWRAASRPATG